ncbi:MAG: hypothetical protein ACX93T_03170 [Bacteroidota bacterium]
MRKMAISLGAGIRTAHLAHAEVSFINFWIYLVQQCDSQETATEQAYSAKKPSYMHILGVGYAESTVKSLMYFLGRDDTIFAVAMDKLSGTH